MINKRRIVRETIRLIASTSTGFVIGNAVKATTPPGLDYRARIGVYIGSWILSKMVGDHGADYTTDFLDEMFPPVKTTK